MEECRHCGGTLLFHLVCENCKKPVSYQQFLEICQEPNEIDSAYQIPREGYSLCKQCGRYGQKEDERGGVACDACGYKSEEVYSSLLNIVYRILGK